MKKKSENNAENAEKINDQNIAMNEFKIQSDRIKKILDEAIFKLKVVVIYLFIACFNSKNLKFKFADFASRSLGKQRCSFTRISR